MHYKINNTFNDEQYTTLRLMYEKAYNEGYTENVTGNACQGDEIVFAEIVYTGSYKKPKFSHFVITRGKIVSDSYGKDKQQHTFTIETATGNIRRKGRNVYKHLTLAKPRSEEERALILDEKHKRGDQARKNRAIRKEISDQVRLDRLMSKGTDIDY